MEHRSHSDLVEPRFSGIAADSSWFPRDAMTNGVHYFDMAISAKPHEDPTY
jgi:hypothetical protein